MNGYCRMKGKHKCSPMTHGLLEWEQFEEWQKRKLAVKPGMISLWHISGKPHDFDEWVRLDLEYIDR